MDVTDPWGTNWHHTSPYDIGLPAASGSSPVDPNDVRFSFSHPGNIFTNSFTGSTTAQSEHDCCSEWLQVHFQVSIVPINICRPRASAHPDASQAQQTAETHREWEGQGVRVAAA
jgi:hypothetical protein